MLVMTQWVINLFVRSLIFDRIFWKYTICFYLPQVAWAMYFSSSRTSRSCTSGALVVPVVPARLVLQSGVLVAPERPMFSKV
jgi:hypothetical protein